MPAEASGTIITFYSYKGGTGRSMALANVAWALASSGQRVLAVDWDLEAPGLHRYFQPFLIDKDLAASDGVIDFLINFEFEAAAVTGEPEAASDPDWYLPHADITTYAASLDWDFPEGGTLDFIPAGRQDYGYSARLTSFNWQNFYERLGGGVFLEAAKEQMREKYDYVLIDSRTGVSDTAGICTLQLPDVLVVCYTLNNQSIEGAAAVAQSVLKQEAEVKPGAFKRNRAGIAIFPVATRIEEAEKQKLVLRREYAQLKFADFPQHIPREKRPKYQQEVQFRYVPYYAYEEVLAVFADEPGDSLITATSRLTAYLTGVRPRPEPVPEAKRREVLRQFEFMHREQLRYGYDLFLSYGRADAEWVSRVAARLEMEEWHGRKLRVFLMGEVAPGAVISDQLSQAITRSRKICVVMSPASLEESWPMLEDALAQRLDAADLWQRLVPLYLRTCELPPALRPLQFIDFRDESEYEFAYQTLLAVVRDEPLPRRSQRAAQAAPAYFPRPPVTGFVTRRDADGRDLVELLREELMSRQNQLVVLWGPGGVGKTVLAAEVARSLASHYGQRVVWASAAGRADFSLSALLDQTAAQLGAPELRSLAHDAKVDRLRALLAEASALLVLDNFETIPPDEQTRCLDFFSVNAPCTVLITSRERVALARNVPVTPMSQDEARAFLQILIEQTQDPAAFAAIRSEDILNSSGYNPLILQWVVAQIDLAQDPAEVLRELTQGEGRAAQVVFDRSFNLPQLGDDGRTALLGLSLFAESASRPALGEVVGLDGEPSRFAEAVKRLASLSLINTTQGGQRLMISGLTRELARARLEADESAGVLRRRFIEYFAEFARSHARPTPENFNALRGEMGNLLRAMDFAVDDGAWQEVVALARRFCDINAGLLMVDGEWDEAARRNRQAAAAALKINDLGAAAQFDLYTAHIYRRRGEYKAAEAIYRQALETFGRLGQEEGRALTLLQLGALAQDRAELEEARRLYQEGLALSEKLGLTSQVAVVLHRLGMIAHDQGLVGEAQQFYERSLSMNRDLGELLGVAAARHELGRLAKDRGDAAAARAAFEESVQISKQYGDQHGISNTLYELGRVAKDEGKVAEAEKLYRESLAISKRLGFRRGEGVTLHELARLEQDQGNFKAAKDLYLQSLKIKEEIADGIGIALTLHELGRVAQDNGEPEEALMWSKRSLGTSEALGYKYGQAITLHELGRLNQDQGMTDEAMRFYQQSLALKKQLGDEVGIAVTLHELGRIEHDHGRYEAAKRLYDESLNIMRKFGHLGLVAFTLDALGRLAQDQQLYEEARRLYTESLDIRKKIGDRIGSTITRHRLKTVPFTDAHTPPLQLAENPEQQNVSNPQDD